MPETGDHAAGEAVAGRSRSRGRRDGWRRHRFRSGFRGMRTDADDELCWSQFDFEKPWKRGGEAEIDVVPKDGGIEILFRGRTGDDA